MTDELDTDTNPVRLLLLFMMLMSLVMTVAIPQAVDAHALLFAGSYVVVQLESHAFVAFAAARLRGRRAASIPRASCYSAMTSVTEGTS